MEVIIGTLITLLICMSPIIMGVASSIYNDYEGNRGNISGIGYLKNQLSGHKIPTTAYFIVLLFLLGTIIHMKPVLVKELKRKVLAQKS